MTPEKQTLQETSRVESKKDFDQMVEIALSNRKLNKKEREEILALLDEKNSKKEKIKAETILKLETFLNSSQGGTDFEKTKKILLKKINENKSISTEKPIEAPERPTEVPVEEEKPTEAPERSTEVSVEEEKPIEAPERPTEVPVEEEKPTEASVKEDSFMDKIGRFFTGKLDINALPKEHQAVVKDLQDAGFKLKPIEGQKDVYEVDMNGIGDKSTLTIRTPTQLDFKTDIVKNKGKDVEYSFENTNQAIDKMTKINELFNVNMELKGIPDLSLHRDLMQEDRYQKLTKQKETLEKDLGFVSE